MLRVEEIYRQARKAYSQEEYRRSLSMLDKNWAELEQYARQQGQHEELVELRQACRDKIIGRQSSPPPKSPAPRRNTRKHSRIKRRRL